MATACIPDSGGPPTRVKFSGAREMSPVTFAKTNVAQVATGYSCVDLAE